MSVPVIEYWIWCFPLFGLVVLDAECNEIVVPSVEI